MRVRSMTGFAQVQIESQDGCPGVSLSIKSVNHRFLDLQLRLPADSDSLEMKLRRAIRGRIARGHVELTLSYASAGKGDSSINHDIVGGYIRAFRAAQQYFGITGEPDLNNALRLPGAMSGSTSDRNEAVEDKVIAALENLVASLDAMREQEGQAIAAELRERLAVLNSAIAQIASHRDEVMRVTRERLRARLLDLMSQTNVDDSRILQEAAILAERSDVQEELARLRAHIEHFSSVLEAGGEVGKKLDFMLQEFNREANTLLSKTSGLSVEGLKITELGLTMKSEIEKLREQVQNLE